MVGFLEIFFEEAGIDHDPTLLTTRPPPRPNSLLFRRNYLIQKYLEGLTLYTACKVWGQPELKWPLGLASACERLVDRQVALRFKPMSPEFPKIPYFPEAVFQLSTIRV